MKVEIERRFLLKSLPLGLGECTEIMIRQDYLKEGGRIRASYNFKNPGKVEYVLCFKKKLSKSSNEEHEENISFEKYTELLNSSKKTLFKKRILFENEDLTWEIDVFKDPLHLIIAEVEIPTEDHTVNIPEILKDHIILEITGDSRFSNYKLAVSHILVDKDSEKTNRTFKIVSIHPYTNRQFKKRVYTSEEDYLRYKDKVIARYKRGYHVKCFELVSGEWKQIDQAEYEGGYYEHKRYEQLGENSNTK